MFATHLQAQLLLAHSAFAEHICLPAVPLAIIPVVCPAACLPVSVFAIAGSTFLNIMFARESNIPADTIELTIKSATITANNCFVFIILASLILL